MWIFGTLIFFYTLADIYSPHLMKHYMRNWITVIHVSTSASFADDYSMENSLLRQKGL